MLGLGLRPLNAGLGLEVCGLTKALALDYDALALKAVWTCGLDFL